MNVTKNFDICFLILILSFFETKLIASSSNVGIISGQIFSVMKSLYGESCIIIGFAPWKKFDEELQI